MTWLPCCLWHIHEWSEISYQYVCCGRNALGSCIIRLPIYYLPVVWLHKVWCPLNLQVINWATSLDMPPSELSLILKHCLQFENAKHTVFSLKFRYTTLIHDIWECTKWYEILKHVLYTHQVICGMVANWQLGKKT